MEDRRNHEESLGGPTPVEMMSEVSSSVLQSAWMLSMAGTAVPHVRPHATSLRGLYVPPQAVRVALEYPGYSWRMLVHGQKPALIGRYNYPDWG